MYSPENIAAYFIKKGIDNKNPLTPIQVMKLCYFSHGYKLAIHDRPLINVKVQAWKYGPVLEGLYHSLKVYGNKKIAEVPRFLNFDDDIFENDDIEILEGVYESLGDVDGFTLSDMTHDADTPWSEAWHKESKHGRFIEIEDIKIKAYFKRMLEDVV